MKNVALLVAGLVLLGVGTIVYYVLGQGNANIVVNGVRDNSEETQTILQYSLGGGLACLGLLFAVLGFVGRGRTAKQQKQIAHIIQTGIATEGVVTYTDKNYSLLVNKKPVYSIVEYTYQDLSGQQHTRRVETIPSDFVIRKNIRVGTKVAIKYASEDSGQSTILL
ncbi:MAG: hypothetical protein K0R65_1525 [Crocinitomicaceae bacterium]|jgi:hypothetical protein|nr:hypothetical protein [Crocinitomicaceae bacterium]